MNNKLKKVMLISLIGVLSLSIVGCKNNKEEERDKEEIIIEEDKNVEEKEDKEEVKNISVEVRGKVVEVSENGNITINKIIDDEVNEDAVINIIADEILDEDIQVGDIVRAYSLINRPQTMEFPESFRSNYVIKEDSDLFYKADYFDNDLVSSDNQLQLVNVDEDLKDNILLVVYDISTRSIPAQTTPLDIYIIE